MTDNDNQTFGPADDAQNTTQVIVILFILCSSGSNNFRSLLRAQALHMKLHPGRPIQNPDLVSCCEVGPFFPRQAVLAFYFIIRLRDELFYNSCQSQPQQDVVAYRDPSAETLQ